MTVIGNLSNAKSPDGMNIASIYAALGDKDHCFEWLLKSKPIAPVTKAGPFFDSVRSDPRFQLVK